MVGWQMHEGRAVALPFDNIDTDQLIPARFMSQPRTEGYGDFLLHDMRRDAEGTLDPSYVLNRHTDATVLIAGANFGSGSSREAAVYALVDAGFQAVIAPSFGDIFAANAVNNGLLPARVEDTVALLTALKGDSVAAHIDLAAGQITLGGKSLSFSLDATWRTKLLNGWDDIDLTASHADAISEYRQNLSPWRWPARPSN